MMPRLHPSYHEASNGSNGSNGRGYSFPSRKSKACCDMSVYEMNKRLINAESISDTASFCLNHIERFNAVNVATAFHRLAKLKRSVRNGRSCSDRFDCLETVLNALKLRALLTASSFKAQEVANLLWGLATLNCDPGSALVEAMSAQA